MRDAPEFTTRMNKAVALLTEARDIFARGPLDFYLKKLIEHSGALLTRFAPFTIGQRVKVAKLIKCEGGWRGCEQMLAVGAVGKVYDIDYYDGKFRIDFCPDEQFYIYDGKRYEPSLPHTYGLSADYLEVIA